MLDIQVLIDTDGTVARYKILLMTNGIKQILQEKILLRMIVNTVNKHALWALKSKKLENAYGEIRIYRLIKVLFLFLECISENSPMKQGF